LAFLLLPPGMIALREVTVATERRSVKRLVDGDHCSITTTNRTWHAQAGRDHAAGSDREFAMTIKEIAGLLGFSLEKAASLVSDGLLLPKSGRIVNLAFTKRGGEFDISDQQLDAFVEQFENEEPGRWPPVAVRRELLVEAGHCCAICPNRVPLQFHHMIDWAVVKHHDPRHMIAVCANCHAFCANGFIDYQAQMQYKSRLASGVNRLVEVLRKLVTATPEPCSSLANELTTAITGIIQPQLDIAKWKGQPIGEILRSLYDSPIDATKVTPVDVQFLYDWIWGDALKGTEFFAMGRQFAERFGLRERENGLCNGFARSRRQPDSRRIFRRRSSPPSAQCISYHGPLAAP
jgi:hypothetical protein